MPAIHASGSSWQAPSIHHTLTRFSRNNHLAYRFSAHPVREIAPDVPEAIRASTSLLSRMIPPARVAVTLETVK